MSNKLPAHTRQNALDELGRIFKALQTDYHDQWDWMEAEFGVECLRAELDAQDTRIKELADCVPERNKWRMACSSLQVDPSASSAATVIDRITALEREIREAHELLNGIQLFPSKALRTKVEKFLKRNAEKEKV